MVLNASRPTRSTAECALAVFGAPNVLSDHAAAAVAAAVSIRRLVAERFGGDAILLTDQSVDTLVFRPPGLTDRGSHALKGKSAAMQVFGLDPTV